MNSYRLGVGFTSVIAAILTTATGMGAALPFVEGFESPYTGGESVSNRNGWTQGGNAVVTNAAAKTGSLGAFIEAGSAITNEFSNGDTNRWWTDMQVQLANWEDDAPVPATPTGFSSAFFMTNGYPVVYNGTTTRWETNRNDAVGGALAQYTTGTWARVLVFNNYGQGQKKWALFIDGVLVTQQIGFADATVTVASNIVVRGGDTKLDDILVTNGIPSGTSDLNGGGIADAWEIHHFGMLVSATADTDLDGRNNLNEFNDGTDPNDVANYNLPAPTLGSFSPATKTVLSAAFTINVYGTNFFDNNRSTVKWNGANRATTYISPTHITAQILVGDIGLGTVGNHALTVTNTATAPGTGGGVSAAVGTFIVTEATPGLQTLPVASPIIVGQTLASSVLTGGSMTNALGAGVTGTFAFTTPGTQITSAGTSSHGVTFTPTGPDAANYTTATMNVDVTAAAAGTVFIFR